MNTFYQNVGVRCTILKIIFIVYNWILAWYNLIIMEQNKSEREEKLALLARHWCDDVDYNKEIVKVEIEQGAPPSVSEVCVGALIQGERVEWLGSIKEMLKAFHEAAYDSGADDQARNPCGP